jgi:putative ABC transport system permease protein
MLLSYAYRSLLARGRANAITLLTVAVFVAGGTLGMAFYLGLKRMTANAAPPANIGVISKGATTEADSVLDLETVNRLAVRDGVRMDGATPLVVREMVTEIELDTWDDGTYRRASRLRGIEELSLRVHGVSLVSGRAPAPNSLEILAGRRAAASGSKLKLGSVVHLPAGDCKVVGIFSAHDSPLEAEIWTPRSAVELHTNLSQINSVTLVADDASRVPKIVEEINTSKDLRAYAASYATWWGEGAGLRAVTLTVLVLLIVLSSVAAVAIAATMNASVVIRIPELATFAAIGIRRSLLGNLVMFESVLLGAAGGVVGILIAIAIGTQAGSLPFGENPVPLAPTLVLGVFGVGLGIAVGLLGSITPAFRVRRLDVLGALR